jgi:predicted O-methyltransferase YrrM
MGVCKIPIPEHIDRLRYAWRFGLLPRADVMDNHAVIWQALSETLWNVGSTAERERSRRIEDHRGALLRDERQIEFVDFGAGARGEGLPRPGRGGVRSTRKVSQLARVAKSPFWGGLLHKIVLRTGARTCVEMGTSLAISASYIASALPQNGRLVTLEGSTAVADIAVDTLHTLVPGRQVDVRVGPFEQTLETVLDEVAPVDFVFLDGDHDQQATERYCRLLLPKMRRRGVMVFDDIRWSAGMRRAWTRISAEIVGTPLDLGVLGIVLLP